MPADWASLTKREGLFGFRFSKCGFGSLACWEFESVTCQAPFRKERA